MQSPFSFVFTPTNPLRPMVVVLVTSPSVTFSETLPFVCLSGAVTPHLLSQTNFFLLCDVLGAVVRPWRLILSCAGPFFADVLALVGFAVSANRAKG